MWNVLTLLQVFNELLTPHMNQAQILTMLSKSEEFNQVKVSDVRI